MRKLVGDKLSRKAVVLRESRALDSRLSLKMPGQITSDKSGLITSDK
jgi:hypothetical protein